MPSGKGPEVHTVTIGSPIAMWEKLVWEVEFFDDIQRSLPDEPEPITYAAINVCITAESLRDWFLKKRKGMGFPTDRTTIYAAVPGQLICEAIANTAKHSCHMEGPWSDGVVQLERMEPTEVTPGGLPFALPRWPAQ